MKIFDGPHPDLPRWPGRNVLCLGTFDGLHLGHQAILAQARGIAGEGGYDGIVAVTFGQHPKSVIEPGRMPMLLSTLEEKAQLLAAAGVQRLVVLRFDRDLAEMRYDVFIREILMQKLGMAHFVLGHDVHLGWKRQGNYRTLAVLADAEGFGLSQVASVRGDGEAVSSTRIRKLVAEGRMEEACRLLGHPYLLIGEVAAGRRRGRQLGFPTANLEDWSSGKLLPARGVYAGWARAAGEDVWLPSVMNCGISPTFQEGTDILLEVHCLEDPGADLYGRRLEVAVTAFLREEIRFADAGELKGQIQEDIRQTQMILDRAPWCCQPERIVDLDCHPRDDPEPPQMLDRPGGCD